MEPIVVSTLAGPIAEESFLGRPNRKGASRDERKAFRLCSRITPSAGLARVLLNGLRARAQKSITGEHGRMAVREVAEALLKSNTLQHAQVQAIIATISTADKPGDEDQHSDNA